MTTRDDLIAGAKDVPSLIASASAADPELAQALTGKALAASKTAWGGIATLIVTWAVSKLGLGWGADVIALVAGGIVLLGLRIATSGPITGWFSKGTPK